MNTITIPAGYTFHAPPQRHAYGAVQRVAPEASDTLHEQFERSCMKCGVTRVTIIGAVNPRAWRLPDSDRLVWSEPVCEAVQMQTANAEGAAA